MKCLQVLLAVAGWLIFVAVNSLADDIKVIANSSVKADTISAADLRRTFLEEKISLADGTHVEPVLKKAGKVHQGFLQEYIGASEDDLQTYYGTLLFTGRGSMPKTFESDADVVAYIARTRGGIGYVSSGSSVEGVKILAISLPSNNAIRKLILRVEPDYPETLKRLNIGGTVRLRVSISARGTVDDVQLLGGNPILGESATLAVLKWSYAPCRSRTITEISISFREHR
jgi:TonB family protein